MRPEQGNYTIVESEKGVGFLSRKTGPSGFEPFISPEENQEGKLFINAYGGSFAQDMELNRKAIERTLKLAHLDGKVFLTSLSPNRQRSIDANPDGSVSAKRWLFFGEKLEEEKDNPYSRVTSIPQGWRIEINDQRLLEELTEKKMDPKKRQEIFVKTFNNLLVTGIAESIVKEKLSSIKDRGFIAKLILSLFIPAGLVSIQYALSSKASNSERIIKTIAETPLFYLYLNIRFKFFRHNLRRFDHFWEYPMPSVEIDKVIEALAYLNLSGRKLVREKVI